MSDRDDKENVPVQSDRDSGNNVPGLVDTSNAARLLKLLKKIASNNADRYQRSFRFTFPFSVNRSDLNDLNADIVRYLGYINNSGPLEFLAIARSQDGELQKYSTFDDFIDKSAKRKELA